MCHTTNRVDDCHWWPPCTPELASLEPSSSELASPEYLIGVEHAVSKASFDVLEDVLTRVDDVEEVLGGGTVDGAAQAAPDADLHLVAEVAVGVLQEHAEDAALGSGPDADDVGIMP